MSTERPRRLGKGLNALLSAPPPVSISADPKAANSAVGGTPPGGEAEGLRMIPVGDVVPSPFQPRRVFVQTEIEQLAASIGRSGVMQPIIVRRAGAGYELVAGERRWRAAGLCGLETIPALVRDLDDATAAEWALVENLQRTDLNAMERARALKGMIDRFGLTQGELAERIGIDRSSVGNLVRLLELEPALQELVEAGALSLGHAKGLLGADASLRLSLAERCVRESWSVRRLEREASGQDGTDDRATDGGPVNAESTGEGSGGDSPADASLRDLERRLAEHLGTKVKIATTGDGARGKMTLSFYTLDHFDDLMSRIGFRTDAT